MNALIFDVDGTLADTETAHRIAFNTTFHEVGLDWHWSESVYAGLLDVAGGKERLLHYWNMIDPEEAHGVMVAETIAAVHALKTRHYTALAAGGKLPLRPGVLRLIGEARAAGMPMAIATTTTPANVHALLRGPLGGDWRSLFVSVCDASTAINKKPAPDVYLAALAGLGVPPSACLAFEDSENGLRAARAAGIPTVVTPTAYTAGHRFDGALNVVSDLGDLDLATLRRWHAQTCGEAA
ncbi:MAG: HAD family hydrolase [Pseudomonadota bacterium]